MSELYRSLAVNTYIAPAHKDNIYDKVFVQGHIVYNGIFRAPFPNFII